MADKSGYRSFDGSYIVRGYLKDQIFRVLSDGEPRSATQVAHAVNGQPSSVSSLLNKLARKGQLRNVEDPYRKARLYQKL